MNKIPPEIRLKIDRYLALFAIVLILVAWILGSSINNAEILPLLNNVLPETDKIVPISNNIYEAWSADKFIGFISIGRADGFGGEMSIAVAVDSSGIVLGHSILDHKETPIFLRRVLRNGFLETFLGKSYNDPFHYENDVNLVTGATYTCDGILYSVRNASQFVAKEKLGFSVPKIESPPIKFGFAELTIIFLFLIGLISYQSWFKHKKVIRWISMISGIIILGFIYNAPMTLNLVNKLLLGFWPTWQTNLFWYFLIGGIVLILLISNRNPYCEWFCPFGAAQECFGVIGGAKVRKSQQFYYLLKWIQRILALLAILIALIFRNPSLTSYEVFSTLFKLIGSNIQFILLGLVLVTALFLKRPWCTYLCPLRPVTDFITLIRNWIKNLWKKNPKTAV